MNRVETIVPGVRLLSPGQQPGSAWERPNLYLLGEDELTLVDAGYDRVEDVEFVIDEIGSARLARIILTHGHIDHAGGAWALRERTGAEVLAHPAEEAALGRRFAGRAIDRRLAEGDRIEAGGFTLEVLHLPGHSPGHLALLIAESGTVLPGDLVTGSGSTLVAPPEGNMKTYMESLRRLQAMTLTRLLPGHGPVVTDPGRRIAELITHRELREICLAKCLADAPAPLSLADLVKAMYLGLIHPQIMGAALATALAHLQKLIEEQVVAAGPLGETNPFKQTFGLTPGSRERVLALYA